jgi:hypothetical protein
MREGSNRGAGGRGVYLVQSRGSEGKPRERKFRAGLRGFLVERARDRWRREETDSPSASPRALRGTGSAGCLGLLCPGGQMGGTETYGPGRKARDVSGLAPFVVVAQSRG